MPGDYTIERRNQMLNDEQLIALGEQLNEEAAERAVGTSPLELGKLAIRLVDEAREEAEEKSLTKPK